MRRCLRFLLIALSCPAALAACSATQNLGSDSTGDGGGLGVNDGGGASADGANNGGSGEGGSADGGGKTEAGTTDGGGASAPGPKQVAGGQGYTCAIASGGAVKCWGTDFFGELGDGQTLNNPVATPTATKVLTSGVVAISGRFRHTCALTSGGAVYCWGQSSQGATGDGNDNSTPSLVTGLGSGVAEIAAGQGHTCARMPGGAVKCWGGNLNHELGNDNIAAQTTLPTDTQVTSGALAVVTGADHTCVLLTSGASCWGHNDMGQLGSAAAGSTATPVAVPGTGGAVDISASDSSTCVLDATGAVKCWGAPLGPFNATTWTPMNLVSLMPGGYVHMCGITKAGALLCWGSNADGELGDGTHNGTGPITPAGFSVVSAVAGEEHTCALTTNGSMMCFGQNDTYQLGSLRGPPASYTPAAVVGF